MVTRRKLRRRKLKRERLRQQCQAVVNSIVNYMMEQEWLAFEKRAMSGKLGAFVKMACGQVRAAKDSPFQRQFVAEDTRGLKPHLVTIDEARDFEIRYASIEIPREQIEAQKNRRDTFATVVPADLLRFG